MAVRVGDWQDDLVAAGDQYGVYNPFGTYHRNPTDDGTLAEPPGVVYVPRARTGRWWCDQAFLTPAPWSDANAYICAFNHCHAEQNGDQWWSVDLSFYPPDNSGQPANSPPICAIISPGEAEPDFAQRSAGYEVTSYGDVHGSFAAFGMGFRLRPWQELYGPSAGLPVPETPENATLEWEFPDPEWLALEAASDEDPVPNVANGSDPVRWHLEGRYGSGAYSSWDEVQGWRYHFGAPPGGLEIQRYGGGVSPWRDLTFVDLEDTAQRDPAEPGFDLIVGCHMGIDFPLIAANVNQREARGRVAQTLALRLRMRARRYRFIYNEPPATRQWPRDTLGMASATRVYPPARTGRVVGGHL